MFFELICKSYGRNAVADALLKVIEHLLAFLVLLFKLLFLLFAVKLNAVGADVCKLLSLKLVEHLNCKFIDILGEIENLIALVNDRLNLRKKLDLCNRFAACIVNRIL